MCLLLRRPHIIRDVVILFFFLIFRQLQLRFFQEIMWTALAQNKYPPPPPQRSNLGMGISNMSVSISQNPGVWIFGLLPEKMSKMYGIYVLQMTLFCILGSSLSRYILLIIAEWTQVGPRSPFFFARKKLQRHAAFGVLRPTGSSCKKCGEISRLLFFFSPPALLEKKSLNECVFFWQNWSPPPSFGRYEFRSLETARGHL